jgi:hypothetical protein
MSCARTGRLEVVRGRAAFQPSWQTNVCSRLRQTKIPTTREFFARVFDLCTVRLDGQ